MAFRVISRYTLAMARSRTLSAAEAGAAATSADATAVAAEAPPTTDPALTAPPVVPANSATDTPFTNRAYGSTSEAVVGAYWLGL